MEGLLQLLSLAVGIALVAYFYLLLPAGMANRRHRSAVFWILVGIIFTPVVSIGALLILGKYMPPD